MLCVLGRILRNVLRACIIITSLTYITSVILARSSVYPVMGWSIVNSVLRLARYPIVMVIAFLEASIIVS